jgi:hypothetical protein
LCDGNARIAAGGLPTIRPFALPHKRFVKEAVSARSKDYLGQDVSYRNAVRHQGRPIFHDDARPCRVPNDDPSALAPSTLWRWLSWLGGLNETVRAACQLIRQKQPSEILHREPWPLATRKYRSQERRRVLQQATRGIVVDQMFQRLFGWEIFPHLATAHGWR